MKSLFLFIALIFLSGCSLNTHGEKGVILHGKFYKEQPAEKEKVVEKEKITDSSECKKDCRIGPITGNKYDLLDTDKFHQYLSETRDFYIQKHPDISEQQKEYIRKGKIFIGMDEEQVEATWGEPILGHRIITQSGRVEDWEYMFYANGIEYHGYGSSLQLRFNRFLSMENGKLISIQEE